MIQCTNDNICTQLMSFNPPERLPSPKRHLHQPPILQPRKHLAELALERMKDVCVMSTEYPKKNHQEYSFLFEKRPRAPRSLKFTVENLDAISRFNTLHVMLHKFEAKVRLSIFLHRKIVIKTIHNRRTRLTISCVINL